MNLIKKLLSLAYYLLVAFILFYLLTSWLSVFYAISGEDLITISSKFEINRGEIEITFYLAIVLLLIYLLPFILGLMKRWRGYSAKESFILSLKIFTGFYIFFIILWIIVRFSFLAYFLYPIAMLPPWFIIVLFLLHNAVCFLEIWLVNKNKWLHILAISITIILIILLFILPMRLKVATGCNNMEDNYCLGYKAEQKKDIQVCEKLPKADRKNCLYIYVSRMAEEESKINWFKIIMLKITGQGSEWDLVNNREIDTDFCKNLSTELKVPYTSTEISMQAYCYHRVTAYFNEDKKRTEICEMIDNTKEAEHCKAYLDCYKIPVGLPDYNECIYEADKIIGKVYEKNEFDMFIYD